MTKIQVARLTDMRRPEEMTGYRFTPDDDFYLLLRTNYKLRMKPYCIFMRQDEDLNLWCPWVQQVSNLLDDEPFFKLTMQPIERFLLDITQQILAGSSYYKLFNESAKAFTCQKVPDASPDAFIYPRYRVHWRNLHWQYAYRFSHMNMRPTELSCVYAGRNEQFPDLDILFPNDLSDRLL